MRNIKLIIEYDGTRFVGWQTQKAQRTVQETIEKSLQKILCEKVSLVGSGRTDSGVHALAQVANFKTSSNLPPGALKKALNTNLPDDIAIKDCVYAPLNFNARFNAKSKRYMYTIYNGTAKIAINRQYVYRMPYRLDVGLMKKAAKELLGRRNFKSFHGAGRWITDFNRCIKRLDIRKDKKNFIYIDIEADGFLYKMVRNIVGTLVEVGRGHMPATGIKEILKARDRNISGPTMPAKGLCLIEVKY